MKLKHMRKRAVKNSLFRVVNELDEKMYPLGLKEEVKYIEDLNTALNRKYSKVEIANMLRNNGSLESIARQMAQAQNIDINQLINQLQGGL